jgi:hypothetical protein
MAATRDTDRNPFAGRPHNAEEHFRLLFYAAVLHLRERLDQLGAAAATEARFPFLTGYFDELRGGPFDGLSANAALDTWAAGVEAWEARSPVRLPLLELKRVYGLDHLALALLFVTGLGEEDPRFGTLLEAVQAITGLHRPTAGLLTGWSREPEYRAQIRRALRHLLDAGVLEVVDAGVPRSEWVLQPPPVLWDVIRGDVREEPASWARYVPSERLPATDRLLLPEPVRRRLARLRDLLSTGAARCVVVRGAPSSGRRTVLGAIARSLDHGFLDLSGLPGADDARWRSAGPLATLLNAMPVVAAEPAPGETAAMPQLGRFNGPVGLALSRHGGLAGPGLDGVVTVDLGFPDPDARRRHWQAGLGSHPAEDVAALAEQHRMTGGTIRRVAAMAFAEAHLAGRQVVTAQDVLAASRTVRAGVLDTLVERVPAMGTWDDLVVSPPTREELRLLERRCRNRERLWNSVPPAFGSASSAGVRALFTGPSGTGKSLAARLLAAALGKDLYRLELSAVVNKYLGETEKNLDRVLTHAEALDVVLLVDEGDALLARRTDVQSSNDRYANLETNYLLQRLESLEGIVVVTTNAEQRLDEAFERRLDVVIDFPAPGPLERLSVWELHLRPRHAVDEGFLREVAARCTMAGGQIRNAVLHASLLALDDGGVITAGHVEAAVRREYRKLGAVCPLRPGTVAYA